MNQEGYPAIILDKKKLTENAAKITDLCEECGVIVAGVIKGAHGYLEVPKAFVDGGVKILCSSRMEQIRRCVEEGINVPYMLIRIPMKSEVAEVVKYADISLNTEIEVLKALNEEAIKQNKKHKVILMVDLGDLREGYWDKDELIETAKEVENNMNGLILAGIGTNLGCYGSILPTKEKMLELVKSAERIENAVGHKLEYVSGGATTSLMRIMDKDMPQEVNMLRIGEGMLVGANSDVNLIYGYDKMKELNDDAFILQAEVIELKKKPTFPIGEFGVDAFGEKPKYVDNGMKMRALVGVGRVDYGSIDDLFPLDKGIKIVGASGDHTILDVEDSESDIRIGDRIEFKLKYSAVLNLTGSENVKIRCKR